jgi:cell division protein FtsI (penicillin-binding protein 3)
MEVSSNIVMAKISDIIGADALFTMARAYGFGTATGIELPGEVRGELKLPTQWSGTTLNSMAYGYEVGVTPLQILCAYAAVANHGVLMKPFVVRSVVGSGNAVVVERRPEAVRRVISRSAAAVLTQMFRGVVEKGTGIPAKIPGLSVAGKTGTARRVIEGKYSQSDYTASFAGYFPAEDPAVVCLVMIENPRDRGYTGGLAAAPVFKAIAERIYATSGRFRSRQTEARVESGPSAVPDVTTLSPEAARSVLRAQGFETNVHGEGTIVSRQSPPPGAMATPRTEVELTTGDVTPGGGAFVVMPDVRGLAIRRALTRLSFLHLDVTIQGSGVVVAQDPQARNQVRRGTHVVIRCEPKTPAPFAAN